MRHLLLMLLLLSLSSVPVSARDRAAAQATYSKATEQEASFRKLSRSQQTVQKYQNVISTYRKVLDLDATYGGCDDALYKAAVLCRELAERHNLNEYARRSVYYLSWLRREYPYSPLRDDALFMEGEIQASVLNDKSAAKETFEEYLKRFGKSSRAPEVVRRLNELDSSPPPAPVPQPPRNTQSVPEASESGQNPRQPTAYLNEIRYWSTSDYTRVVMDLDREVEFVHKEIDKPYRIYFDLKETILTQDVKDRDFSIGDDFLHRIRVGQNTRDVARVVLDFKNKGSFTVFNLYNPFRVVIDIKDLDKGKTLQERKEKLAKFFKNRNETAGGETESRPAETSKPPVKVAETPPPAKTTETPPKDDNSRPIKPSGLTMNGERTLPRILGMKVGKIVIDPGHGGKDSGSIGYKGLREKDLALSIAKELKAVLEARLNVDVILTRDNDVFLPLEQRAALANIEQADLFISLHANAFRNKDVAGVETYYLGLTRDKRSQLLASIENAASQQSLAKLEDSIRKITMYEKMNESEDFARNVHREFFKTIHSLHPNSKDRGVKKAPLVVLIGTDVPSILLEFGFISHKREAQIISNKKNQKVIAESISRGIEEYLSNLGTIARRMGTEEATRDAGHGN